MIWRTREIKAMASFDRDQIQPASLDLRLGETAFRVRASFLPGSGCSVMERVKQLDGYALDLTQGAVLEKGCVYVVPLMEALALKNGLTGFANPKSTTGRLDILTRLITDNSEAFDHVVQGYQGQLYAEISPRTFSIVVRTGARLNQIRFRRGSPQVPPSIVSVLREEAAEALGDTADSRIRSRDRMLGVSLDLEGTGQGSLVGFRAKKHTDRVDLANVGGYDPLEFWEPIYNHRRTSLILDPDAFYILVTRESVRVPPQYAAEMVAYDTSVGEFRVHYAGFFDPGFGMGQSPSKAVLEVRSHEVPFMLEHGQTIGWLRYEPMISEPKILYGAGLSSSYQGQGLMLAKQFRGVGR